MKSFDYKTHLRNKKGKVYAVQPYKRYVSKQGVKMERPPGSGNFFNEDGTPIEVEVRAEVKEAVIEAKAKIEPKIEIEVPKLNEEKIEAKKASIKSKAKVEVKGESKSKSS